MIQITIIFTGAAVLYCVFSAAIGFVLYDEFQIMKRRTQNCRCDETENDDEEM